MNEVKPTDGKWWVSLLLNPPYNTYPHPLLLPYSGRMDDLTLRNVQATAAHEHYYARSHAYRAKLHLQDLQEKLKTSPWLIHTKFKHELKAAEIRVAYTANTETYWEQQLLHLQHKYDPNQPRMPAGSSEGGQWTYVAGYARGKERQDFIDYLRGKPRMPNIQEIQRSREGDAVSAQFRPRGGGGIVGRFPDATPGQQMRHALAQATARDAVQRVRQRDSDWQQPQSLTSTIDGEIAHYEAVARAAEAKLQEIRAGINLIKPRTESLSFDRSNLQSKLKDYLLNPENSRNQGKADWFGRALGFNRNNWRELEAQIQFDESQAVLHNTNSREQIFNQVLPIIGRNGRVINVKFGFAKDITTGKVRFITGFPRSK